MDTKKYILLGITVIALSAGSYLTERSFLSSANAPAAKIATTTVSSTASLSVEGTRYQIPITIQTSVFNAMRALASTTAFNFSSREFSGMGEFVESINGKKNADGYYWILYVNGAASQTGASQTAVSPKDTVEWRFEKGY